MGNVPTFTVDIEQGIGHGDGGGSIAIFENVSMNLVCQGQVLKSGNGLEDSGESEVIR